MGLMMVFAPALLGLRWLPTAAHLTHWLYGGLVAEVSFAPVKFFGRYFGVLRIDRSKDEMTRDLRSLPSECLEGRRKRAQ
jgi:hypothetical protein